MSLAKTVKKSISGDRRTDRLEEKDMQMQDNNSRPFDMLALGEALLRLSPPGEERLDRGDVFEKRIGGAELNVVSGAAMLGLRTGMISVLPASLIGDFARSRIRFCGVSDDYLVYDDSPGARLGVYYYESGVYPRKPQVVYDRRGSSICRISPDMFPDTMYASTRCFHTSGITLALHPDCRRTAIDMIRRFKEAGSLISFDVNFRGNLWSGDEARRCIEEILPYVDYFFCSQETARLTFGKKGDRKEILQSFASQYPLSIIASTQRIVHSPRRHTFGSIIYDAKDGVFYEEEPYRDIDVIDRIGSGDAYISGVIYGMLKYGDCRRALEYGNAVSAVKNTIPGDLPSLRLSEIDRIIADHQTVGPVAEMDR